MVSKKKIYMLLKNYEHVRGVGGGGGGGGGQEKLYGPHRPILKRGLRICFQNKNVT